MRWSVCMLLAMGVAGCATAGKGNPLNQTPDGGVHVVNDSGGSNQPPVDAPPPMIDAAPIDAAPTMTNVTLTQTPMSTISTTSLACGVCEAGTTTCTDYRTNEDAYYRVFDLASLGVTSTLHVTQVDFAVQEAGGTQSVQVRIGTYAGAPGATLDTGATDWAGGSITAINSATVSVPAGTNTTISAPILADVPAGSKMIVEVFSPDHTAQTNTYFFLGSSTGTETTPGYLRAPGCMAGTASTPAALGQSASPFIINVTGTY